MLFNTETQRTQRKRGERIFGGGTDRLDRQGKRTAPSMPRLASHACQCVPAFFHSLGEAWLRLRRRPFQDGQGRGVLQGRRRRRSLAGVVAGKADGDAQQGIFTADTLAVLFL